MQASISVDVGGTFTDCAVLVGGRLVSAKRPTSPHNLAEAFLEAVAECARRLEVAPEALLAGAREVRYATTVALNHLLARQGPRLALLATAGAEEAVYVGMGAQWADGLTDRERSVLPAAQKPLPLIPRERCVGVRERLDSRGAVLRPLDEGHLREEIHRLIAQGVQGIVVSLLWSFLNPAHELRVREVIREEFPPGNLGAVPVVLAHEVVPARGEYQRTMTAVLCAYLHDTMQADLTATADELRRRNCAGPLTIVQNNGGVAGVWRTTPVMTVSGGPVAGLMGSARLATRYGDGRVIATDMGGTTFDIGIVARGQPLPQEFRPVIDRWLVHGSMLEVRSIGAGGGTIARLNTEQGNRLEIGPASAGAVPGPAAYDLGGLEPTVTDADLVLGYLNPDAFAGGQRRLSRARAELAISQRIARPLGLDVVEAAARIRRLIDERMGHTILKETVLRGHDPREFTLFAYGGAGPTHCCDYARAVRPARIVTFAFSPVFCALGSAMLDYVQTLVNSRPFLLMHPHEGGFSTDYEGFNNMVAGLQERLLTDLQAAGAPVAEVSFALELDLKFGGQVHVKRIASPRLLLQSTADAQAVYDTFVAAYSRTFSPFSLYPEGGVVIEAFVLHARVPNEPVQLPTYPLGPASPVRALTGRRDVFWLNEGRWISTPTYAFSKLQAGCIIEGPGIVEDAATTHAVPPGYRFALDRHLAAIIEQIG